MDTALQVLSTILLSESASFREIYDLKKKTGFGKGENQSWKIEIQPLKHMWEFSSSSRLQLFDCCSSKTNQRKKVIKFKRTNKKIDIDELVKVPIWTCPCWLCCVECNEAHWARTGTFLCTNKAHISTRATRSSNCTKKCWMSLVKN